MEANKRRVIPRRKPLSDCTNTSSSSSSSLKPHKTNPTSSSALNKPKRTNLDNAANPTSPSPPIPSTPSLPGIVDVDVDVEASEPTSVVYSRRTYSRKRKRDKGKAVAVPESRTPDLKISDSREKNDEFEGVNLPKAKALTVPRTKKQCALLPEKDMFKDPQMQDFLAKQNAYFKEIDEFELLVEAKSDDDSEELD